GDDGPFGGAALLVAGEHGVDVEHAVEVPRPLCFHGGVAERAGEGVALEPVVLGEAAEVDVEEGVVEFGEEGAEAAFGAGGNWPRLLEAVSGGAGVGIEADGEEVAPEDGLGDGAGDDV